MSRRTTNKKPRQAPKTRRAQSAQPKQRLQRLLAASGFGSRRQCEELIAAGRVDVDGEIVTKLGTTVDPAVNKIRVDGELLKKEKLVYYAVNKPIGVVTTNSDPQGRPRVVDLVPHGERVYPVGRLDRSSEGLILLTNDGDLAQKLTHPKYGVRKIYRVTVAGRVDSETMKQMRHGIFIAEGRVRVEGARIFKSRSKATEMEIVLREGKNREIRRILARLGHKVLKLRRIAVGPLRLGDMPPGAHRLVSRDEVRKLQRATETSADDSGKQQTTSRGQGRDARKKGSRPTTGGAVHGPPAAMHRDSIAATSQTSGAVIGGDAPQSPSTGAKRKSKQPSKRKAKRASGGTPSKKNASGGRGRRGAQSGSQGASAKGSRSTKRRSTKKPATAKRGGAKRATKKRATRNRSK